MKQPQATDERLLIGDLVFDRETRSIRQGGKTITLPPLSYRLFECLVDAAPGVVTQEQLVESVWNGRVATPETVTQRVKLLRDALDDDARSPRYIGLVRGQGYRIIPSVTVEPADEEATLTVPPPAGGRITARRLVAIMAAIALIAVALYLPMLSREAGPPAVVTERDVPANSVAVIPFDGNADGQATLIRAGLGDSLRDQLGRMGGLQVAARSSSILFEATPADAVTVAHRLGVRHLIEGSVNYDNDVFTISLSLVDGDTGLRWWSDSFETDERGLPAMQSKIARDVMAKLLPNRPITVADSQPASLNPTANRLVQTASQYYAQVRAQPIVDVEQLDHSIDLFRRAVQLDPRSAVAHIRLAQALLYRGEHEAARDSITRAMEIDSELAEVQHTLGLYRWVTYEDGSGLAQKRAIELDPSNADAHEAYAKWIWHQLDTEKPEAHFRKALEIDPASLNRYTDLGNYYGMSGKREQALEIASQIPVLFADAPAYMAVARILELLGEFDQAIAWALRAHEEEPEREEAAWMVAELYARIGDFAKARDYESGPQFNLLYWARDYDSMIDFGQELVFESNEPEIWFGLAFAANATGDHEAAKRYLGIAGIPARAYSENRRANEEEAFITLADALKESGDAPKAMVMANWFRPFLVKMIATGGEEAWWPHTYLACVDSILDRDEDALSSLERMQQANGLPWYPLLVDAPCFRRFKGDPRYDAVVDAIDARKSRLREQLPATLARLQGEWSSGQKVAAAD